MPGEKREEGFLAGPGRRHTTVSPAPDSHELVIAQGTILQVGGRRAAGPPANAHRCLMNRQNRPYAATIATDSPISAAVAVASTITVKSESTSLSDAAT